jgi:glycine cleavage system H protein
VADFDLPDKLHYTPEDEWVRLEEGRVLVGVTDYAQQQLGDVVFVELPELGASFEKGDPFGVIESVKAVSDLYAPIAGEVAAVNGDLAERPELVNEDCYGDGWMLALVPSDAADLEGLMDAAAYRKHISERPQD